ncbi:MAG: thioesterase [Proteobacteria bacterium]|nr:MAG: thioesterase [Pseudomonadota bacterium]
MSQASIDPVSFQVRLYREFPISAHMKIDVLSVTKDAASVSAPLAPNINHQGTAFGGSVNSLAVVACWSLVTGFVELEGLEADYIVIQDSQIEYSKPVAMEFRAEAKWESEEGRARFLETLKKKARARASFIAHVSTAEGVCATLKARFAAQLIR